VAAVAAHAVPEVSAADIFAGRSVYEKHCAGCHGADGTPVIPGTPDFTRGQGLEEPDRVLIRRIRTGNQLMPGFDHIISERDMLNVLSFARSLRR
jgi:cytochrome c6